MERDSRQFENASELEWGELEDLLAAFAKLVKSDVPFSRVARELVDQLVKSLAAVGAALWMSDDEATLRLERQVNLEVLGTDALAGGHRQYLVETVRSGQAEIVRPHQGDSATSNYTLVLVPLVIDTDVVGVVEVIQRPTISGDALDGNLRFTSLLAELAAEHLRRQEIRELRHGRRQTRQVEDFLHSLHRTLDSRVIVSELANEGRRHIGCDRVSVAIRRGRHYKLVAVSAVDVINRRSIAVKRLEKLISLAAATGEEFWFEEGAEQPVAPQIERVLSKYLDESHCRSIGIVPLRAPRKDESTPGGIIGLLVVEGFDAHQWDLRHEMTNTVAKHGALALANALRYRSLPTIPFLRFRRQVWGESTYSLAKGIAIAALIAAVAATFFIQTDFNVYARGELQPAVRQHIFAPLDGEVSLVKVVHGDHVKSGQTLVLMSSPELDLEIQKIQGEHDATLQRSQAIESALLDYNSSEENELKQVNQLAGEQEELNQLFASQQERLIVLRDQRKKLDVRSPIAGEILTWETEEELLNRPVRSGQRLMTVADLEGAWEAELRVPDDRVGELLKLHERGDQKLVALFDLATSADVEHRGEVVRIARRTEIDGDNKPIVRVTVAVDKSSLVDPRPGASLDAKIFCGQRSIFYVWCHDFIDRIQGWYKF